MRYPLLLILIINFRWCLKASSPPGAALGLYTQVLGEMKCTCQLSKIEIKTVDIYFFHKHRYCAIHLFTYRDLAFSEFPVGTYLRSRPATSKGAMRNLRFQIVLPRLLEFDTWQYMYEITFCDGFLISLVGIAITASNDAGWLLLFNAFFHKFHLSWSIRVHSRLD